nr:5'-nucleotidase C-terminal domain-containing protein [Marinobacter bryozoorum]
MIDELTGSGINKIILLTHYQYQNDLELANRLSGVDVIIGGDSHSLLGDFSAYGLESSGPYPTLTTNADGDQVCVAQAWQYSWVVGELSVEWNDEGVGQSCNGVPHLLLDEPLVREDANEEEYELTGAEIRSVLNEAVDYAHTDSSGAYPYAAGLRWYVDMNRSAGTRLHDIEYRERNEGAWLPLNDDTHLTVVSKPSMDEYSTQNYTAAP